MDKTDIFIEEVERRIDIETAKQVDSYKAGQDLKFTIRTAMLAGASIYSNMIAEESKEGDRR